MNQSFRLPNAALADHIAAKTVENGFFHVPASFYVDEADEQDMRKLQGSYNELLPDANTILRTRAHSKYVFENGRVLPVENAFYLQNKKDNDDLGGVVRVIPSMDDDILALELVQKIIWLDMELAMRMGILPFPNPVDIGLHQIRYQPTKDAIAYSSPPGLHKDTEEVVFIHIVHVSRNLCGGENVICRTAAPKVEEGCPPFLAHINLTEPAEALCVTRKHFHQVFPMSVTAGQGYSAYRDVLLVTFQAPKPE